VGLAHPSLTGVCGNADEEDRASQTELLARGTTLCKSSLMTLTNSRPVMRLLLSLIFLCQVCHDSNCLSQTPTQTTFDVDKDRQTIVSLDGLWHRQVGDDPRWADPQFDDSSWPVIRPTQPWSEQKFAGSAWYRAKVKVPANAGPLALYLYYIDDSHQVFVDGKLLVSTPGLPPHPQVYGVIPAVVQLPEHADTNPYTLTLAIRVWLSPEYAAYHQGGISPGSIIGSPALAQDALDIQITRWSWGLVSQILLACLETLAACAALALFTIRRKEREYLWFALLLFASAGSRCSAVYYQFHTLSNTQLVAGQSILNAAGDFAQIAFYFRLLGARRNWVFWVVFASAGCDLLLTVPGVLGWINLVIISVAVIVLFLPTTVWILALLFRRAAQGFQDARLLIAPVIFSKIAVLISIGIWVCQTLNLYRGSTSWFQRTFTWPFNISLTDIGDTLFLIGMLAVLILRFTRTRLLEETYEREREAARTVQQLLIPETIPDVPGFKIDCVYRPYGEVGGDFFQILPLAQGGIVVAVGDVSGKGLPAAMTVSLLVGTLRTLVHYTSAPGEILAAMNQRMIGRTGGGFTTCLVVRIDPDGEMLAANAGHLSPYLAGIEIELSNGLPLGLAGNVLFAESAFRSPLGAQLTLVTDGIPEARAKSGSLYGFERTTSVSQQPAEEIASSAQRFGQDDDITVVTIVRNPDGKL
jgi:hypothetical protein